MEAIVAAGPLPASRPPRTTGLLDQIRVSGCLVLLALGVVTGVTYLGGYDRTNPLALLAVPLLTGVVEGIWISSWAVVNRLKAHEWKLVAHTGIAFGFLTVDFAVITLHEWIEFAFSTGAVFAMAWVAVQTIVFATQLTAHLQQFSRARIGRQFAVCAVIGLTLFGGGHALVALRPAWLPRGVSFESQLKPIPPSWLPKQETRSFITGLSALRGRVDAEATELAASQTGNPD